VTAPTKPSRRARPTGATSSRSIALDRVEQIAVQEFRVEAREGLRP
jgi:hypothetical protein